MRTVVSKPEALVIDDFLDPVSFELVWAYVQSEEFEHVHRMGWVNAWRLSDGVPLRGPVTLSHSTDTDRFSPIHPTGKGIDLVVEKILSIKAQFVDWVGAHGEDWSHFFCRPYIYAANMGLSWHRDNQNQTTGAFTFYCHPTWNVQWGGELLVADAESRNFEFPQTQLLGDERRFLGTHLDNTPENEALLETGAGMYILPKPNRLVVVPAGVLHGIKKVDPAAGSNVRVSLQGTFMYPDRGSVKGAPRP
ncbi:2OG-Fe(II) oxygenase [Corallococcus carmarthensis]|uniref:Proline hydroxylase n=1 Tax=Corallococcus carmarthensis TaxID=2316728 RepID=A0A3A8KCC6_9BACT|nr:2OG-Fe(II) oxygenase [Corallococcus carmarthensis]NOK18521.1 proline hydroxylase [Corallococcus carmarthensis]RKG99463.1 proline hydroxylase [Corallococcus carmarthensis]